MPVIFAVAFGGAFGAVLRYLVMLAVPVSASGFPTAIFAVNIAGSALLGLCFGWFEVAANLPIVLRTFLTVGFLGALTTFSTFSADAVRLIEGGAAITAFLYIILSVAGGLMAFWAALSFVRLVAV